MNAPLLKHYPPRCPTRKVRYLTEQDARREAGRIYNQKGDIHGAYQCPHCFNWHRTSLKS